MSSRNSGTSVDPPQQSRAQPRPPSSPPSRVCQNFSGNINAKHFNAYKENSASNPNLRAQVVADEFKVRGDVVIGNEERGTRTIVPPLVLSDARRQTSASSENSSRFNVNNRSDASNQSNSNPVALQDHQPGPSANAGISLQVSCDVQEPVCVDLEVSRSNPGGAASTVESVLSRKQRSEK